VIRTRIAAAATAALLVVGLSACSSDSGSSSGSASGGDAKATTLKLGYFANFTHAPAIIGIQDGTFQKDLGDTKLSTNVFDAGPAATEALLSGSIDAAFIGPGPTINAYVQSKALKVVAGTAANGAALVVKPSITSAAQLKGKTLATPQLANTQDIALRYWLKQQGLTTTTEGGGDVKISPQGNSDSVNAFKQGEIDGAWVPEPYATQLVNAGGTVLVDEKSLWPDDRFVVTNLVVSTKYLDQYPGTVNDLLQGLIAAEDEIASDPTTARTTTNDAIATITGTPIDDAVLKTAWDNVDFTIDPIASSLLAGAKHAQAVGLLTGDVSGLKDVYDLKPLNTLLKAAGKATVSAG
jgi:NitT/TauT family transport system substrate-binding protein